MFYLTDKKHKAKYEQNGSEGQASSSRRSKSWGRKAQPREYSGWYCGSVVLCGDRGQQRRATLAVHAQRVVRSIDWLNHYVVQLKVMWHRVSTIPIKYFLYKEESLSISLNTFSFKSKCIYVLSSCQSSSTGSRPPLRTCINCLA